MKIDTVTIRGFRCFDAGGETIELDDLTCFVGPNASGKTAAMMALVRLFGETTGQRQVVPTDFHLGAGEDLNAVPSRSLSIECRLSFPELRAGEPPDSPAVPETFNQMIVDGPDATPYCRIRLEATWTNDGSLAGDVDQSTSWITTGSEDPEVIDNGHRRKVMAGDRTKIRVLYVPATRDPEQQVRGTAATAFGRLLDAISWGGADDALKAELEGLQTTVSSLAGVTSINAQVQAAWDGFYDGRAARQVAFQALDQDPASLLRRLAPSFRPGEGSQTMRVSDLGDGLRSLFSLSLSLGLFRVEELLRTRAIDAGFKAETAEKLPILTVFAVEEPENHLSPHHLGRVVDELDQVARADRAQVLISSHSPSIMGRVEPDHVRYFLGHELARSSHVRAVPLPSDDQDEAFKYVREGVRGFPELYFARLVILGEGPSEQLVLQRLFEASGTPLDKHLVSVAPLGGRHVNHFWRLLHGLGIPYLTLLDLDREKEGAGWCRIQYVRDQLVALHGAGNEALRFTDSQGSPQTLEEDQWDTLADRPVADVAGIDAWLSMLEERFGVFFSSPLDLDFSMLEAFPDVYQGLVPDGGGPRLPVPGSLEYSEAIGSRMRQVLAADVGSASPCLGSTYSEKQKGLFAWYKYLFLDRSKPVSHMRALLGINGQELATGAPAELRRLVDRARGLLGQSKQVDDVAPLA